MVYADVEIRAGLTTLTSLTSSWTTNLGAPVAVYRGPLRVRFLVDQWVPLGLPVPIPWGPTSAADNLRMGSRSASRCRNSSSSIGPSGPSCPSSVSR